MIDTSLRSPNIILSDVGKQFIISEFKKYTINMRLIIKNVLIKIYYFIRLIKYYYGPFCQISNIITAKFFEIKPKFTLKLSFKILNDLIGPNDFILTLLVFCAYSRMIDIDALKPTINEYNIAIYKAIKEVRRSHIS